MADYPSAIPTLTDPTTSSKLNSPSHAGLHADANAEIIAIATELGTTPSGSYSTVKDRLEAIEAAIPGTIHTQNTDAGTSGSTFYVGGSSASRLKNNSDVIEIRNGLDTAYAGFRANNGYFTTLEGTSGQVTMVQVVSAVSASHSHTNSALLGTYTQTEVDLADAVSKKHTQDTDSGTSYETFQLDIPNGGARIGSDSARGGILEARNADDDGFEDMKALGFRGPLVQDITDDGSRPSIRYNAVGNYWESSNDGNTYVRVAQGLSVGGSANAIQYHDGTVGLGGSSNFTFNPATNAVAITGSLGITGTMTISSNTLVTNLNADLLDGHESTYFEQALTHSAPLARVGNTISITQSSGSTDGYLSSTNWNTFNGKENVLSFSAPLGRAVNTISITQASGTTDGYLSSTDWSTFNNKQSTLNQNLTVGGAPLTITGGTNAVAAATAITFNYNTSDFSVSGNNLQVVGSSGTGNFVRVTGASLTTPDIGAATATSVNKLTITAPTTSATLTIADGKTFQCSNTITLTGTDSTSFAFPATGGNVYVAGNTDVAVADGGTGKSTWTQYGIVYADTAGSLNQVGIGTAGQVLKVNSGATGYEWGTGSAAYTGTFTNATLSAGKLTITHNKALSAPYPIIVSIFDNNYKQIIPDEVTGAANSVEIDLTSYGTLSGTWGYVYVA